MKHLMLVGAVVLGVMGLGAGQALAELTIHDVQFSTAADGSSPYDGQIQDVRGGVVVHKWSGFQDRIYLQDPAYPTWGGVCVKDSEHELVAALEIGDWVSFDQIYIEEYRGTTFLQFNRGMSPAVSYTVESSGNPVPAPVLLSVTDIGVPTDHARTEPYESMVVTVEDITIGDMDLGKAGDNYELIHAGAIAWGTDYMNVDAGGPYGPHVVPGVRLLSITGIVEQYEKSSSGWDYYQLNTRSVADVVGTDSVPTVSQWGLVVLALVLLVAAKVTFRRANPQLA